MRSRIWNIRLHAFQPTIFYLQSPHAVVFLPLLSFIHCTATFITLDCLHWLLAFLSFSSAKGHYAKGGAYCMFFKIIMQCDSRKEIWWFSYGLIRILVLHMQTNLVIDLINLELLTLKCKCSIVQWSASSRWSVNQWQDKWAYFLNKWLVTSQTTFWGCSCCVDSLINTRESFVYYEGGKESSHMLSLLFLKCHDLQMSPSASQVLASTLLKQYGRLSFICLIARILPHLKSLKVDFID